MEKGTIVNYTVAVQKDQNGAWEIESYTIEYPDVSWVHFMEEAEHKYETKIDAGEISKFKVVEATMQVIGYVFEEPETSNAAAEAEDASEEE